jgi:hypothetical protein
VTGWSRGPDKITGRIEPRMKRFGYMHPMYAQSLIEHGEPLELPASQGWILKRSIAGTSQFDGMGCYPIFVCQNWSALGMDLAGLADQLVCVSLVTDPFGRYNQQDLLSTFVDIARPYKQHFVIDLQQRPKNFVATHHQRNADKALSKVVIEDCVEPLQYLDEWIGLYNNLIERHQITGITRFSAAAFVKQLSIPGIAAFRATLATQTIGMILWYVQGNIGYYHLGAYNADGYRLKVSFALFWKALEHFSSKGLQWLSLGAGAGTYGDMNDGLTRFKKGWSTSVRTVYFCGRIFNQKKYQEIVQSRGIPPSNYFPAYRSDEP